MTTVTAVRSRPTVRRPEAFVWPAVFVSMLILGVVVPALLVPVACAISAANVVRHVVRVAGGAPFGRSAVLIVLNGVVLTLGLVAFAFAAAS